MCDKDHARCQPHNGEQKQTLFLPPRSSQSAHIVQLERQVAAPSELNDLAVGTCVQAAHENTYVPTCTGEVGKKRPPTAQSGSLILYTL